MRIWCAWFVYSYLGRQERRIRLVYNHLHTHQRYKANQDVLDGNLLHCWKLMIHSPVRYLLTICERRRGHESPVGAKLNNETYCSAACSCNCLLSFSSSWSSPRPSFSSPAPDKTSSKSVKLLDLRISAGKSDKDGPRVAGLRLCIWT